MKVEQPKLHSQMADHWQTPQKKRKMPIRQPTQCMHPCTHPLFERRGEYQWRDSTTCSCPPCCCLPSSYCGAYGKRKNKLTLQPTQQDGPSCCSQKPPCLQSRVCLPTPYLLCTHPYPLLLSLCQSQTYPKILVWPCKVKILDVSYMLPCICTIILTLVVTAL
jgi:hypothetical protein